MPDRPRLDPSELGGDAACWAHLVDEDPLEDEVPEPVAPPERTTHRIPEAIRRRMDRLAQELSDSGVSVPSIDTSILLKEIDRARFPRRHERRFPSYGAIVSDDPDTTSDALRSLGTTRHSAPKSAAQEVRAMADGVQSFSFITPTGADLVLLPQPVVREMQLVRFRRALGPAATIVSRSDDGVVRIFDRHQIVIFDGTRWWTKPDAHEYAVSVLRAVPDAPQEITQAILDFCVHTAGPGAGGTILVWCPDPAASDGLAHRSVQAGHLVPFDVALTEPTTHSAARHLLFQVDGAGILDGAGRLTEVGVHLRPSSEAHERIEVPTYVGTRHAAAMRTSHDVPTAVFFVVSEDGPVTVCAGGRVVASIDMTSSEAADATA